MISIDRKSLPSFEAKRAEARMWYMDYDERRQPAGALRIIGLAIFWPFALYALYLAARGGHGMLLAETVAAVGRATYEAGRWLAGGRGIGMSIADFLVWAAVLVAVFVLISAKAPLGVSLVVLATLIIVWAIIARLQSKAVSDRPGAQMP